MSFAITSHHGFHMTFPNGVTVSVQFGGGNYCDNNNMPIGTEKDHHVLTSGDAEVAVWKGTGGKDCENWITKGYSYEGRHGVLGHQTADDVLKILNWAAAYGTTES